MKTSRIEEPPIDFNDPERGFAFTGAINGLELSFIDWRDRTVIFRFEDVYAFSYMCSNGYKGLPEAEFLEVQDSDAVARLKANGTVADEEELHHLVLSTNEDEWCEIVAGSYRIEKKG